MDLAAPAYRIHYADSRAGYASKERGHMVMPNLVAAIPGVDAMASKMMKNLIKKNGVASIEDLRDLAIEADVRMIGCQMTMDLFEYSLDAGEDNAHSVSVNLKPLGLFGGGDEFGSGRRW